MNKTNSLTRRLSRLVRAPFRREYVMHRQIVIRKSSQTPNQRLNSQWIKGNHDERQSPLSYLWTTRRRVQKFQSPGLRKLQFPLYDPMQWELGLGNFELFFRTAWLMRFSNQQSR